MVVRKRQSRRRRPSDTLLTTEIFFQFYFEISPHDEETKELVCCVVSIKI